MTDSSLFSIVGMRESSPPPAQAARKYRGFPWLSAALFLLLSLCCLFAEFLMTKDPSYLDLAHCSVAPNGEFLFGTDALGRDIFSGIWYGGRISLAIGLMATLLSTVLAISYGTLSGLAPRRIDALMMRFAEIFLSVPALLLVLFLQALLGSASILSLSLLIGTTSWVSIAKVVRSAVRQLRSSEFVIASRCMGGSFFHILRRHLLPNFLSSILFMVVMNVRNAISMEATLTFLGMGLPLETVSLGGMLSLAETALLQGSWWSILIPGAFLAALLMCLTNLGTYFRKTANRKERNL